jgi:hypothetical protein
VALIALTATVAGCKKDPAATLKDNPAAACMSADTAANLVAILGKNTGANMPVSIGAYKPALAEVVLDSADKTTGKVSCTGKLSVHDPDLGGRELGARLSYSIQPTADGEQVYYTITSADGPGLVPLVIAAHEAVTGSKLGAKPQAQSPAATAAPDVAAQAPAPNAPDDKSAGDDFSGVEIGNYTDEITAAHSSTRRRRTETSSSHSASWWTLDQMRRTRSPSPTILPNCTSA